MPPLPDDAMMSWAEIGRLLGISKKSAQRTGERALAKLRAALEAQGVTADVFYAYLHMKDHLETVRHENWSAIVEAGEPTTDDADPKPWTKLRTR